METTCPTPLPVGFATLHPPYARLNRVIARPPEAAEAISGRGGQRSSPPSPPDCFVSAVPRNDASLVTVAGPAIQAIAGYGTRVYDFADVTQAWGRWPDGSGGSPTKKMAEGVEFEPTALKIRATVFKTASLNRSDTPPTHGL